MKTRCIETTSRVIEHHTYRMSKIANLQVYFLNLELLKSVVYYLDVTLKLKIYDYFRR